jgi:hypothetical protein
MEKEKRKRGPRPLPPGERRGTLVRIAMKPAERAALERAACARGLSPSTFARQVLADANVLGEAS